MEDEIFEKLVARLLENEMVNNRYIPDALERRIYINLFKVIVGHMKHAASNTSVQFLGHELTFTITPIPLPDSTE